MAIALLHSFIGTVPDEPGLFPIGNTIPKGWEPDPNTYQPGAFPTPYGRAEATALVLGTGQPGVPLFDHFQWLLMGLLSGVLRVVPDDLRRLDNLGQSLDLVDPEARYFARIVWDEPGKTTTFGVTYRTCLLWSHARRTTDDWNRLSNAIAPRRSIALALLAQWRETLHSAKAWSAQAVPWQRAIELILQQGGDVRTDAASLRSDTAHQGPLYVLVSAEDPTQKPRLEWLYLPVYAKGRLQQFRSRLQAKPSKTSDSAVLLDASGAACARISTLPQVAAGASKLAAGIGTLEIIDTGAAAGIGAPQTEELARLLEPVRQALKEAGRSTDPASIRAAPWAYPDALRLMAFLQEGIAEGVILSNAAHMACIGGAQVPDESSDQVASLQIGQQKLVLMDALGDKGLFELRALGLTLYRVFIGELGIKQGVLTTGVNVSVLGQVSSPFAADSKNPLESAAWVTQIVAAEPPLAIRKRFATLQRLVATYENAEPMLAKSARSFAAWAADRGASVAPLGKPADRNLSFNVGGQVLVLGVDVPTFD